MRSSHVLLVQQFGNPAWQSHYQQAAALRHGNSCLARVGAKCHAKIQRLTVSLRAYSPLGQPVNPTQTCECDWPTCTYLGGIHINCLTLCVHKPLCKWPRKCPTKLSSNCPSTCWPCSEFTQPKKAFMGQVHDILNVTRHFAEFLLCRRVQEH